MQLIVITIGVCIMAPRSCFKKNIAS